MSNFGRNEDPKGRPTIINPSTGRFILVGGKTHKRLIKAGTMENTIRSYKKQRKDKLSQSDNLSSIADLEKRLAKLKLSKKKELSRSDSSSSSSSDEIKTKKFSRLRKRQNGR